jgi:hypothetical protein
MRFQEKISIMRLQARLAKLKKDQRAKYNKLKDRFAAIYHKLKQYDISEFTTEAWEAYNADLEKLLLPSPVFSFFRVKTVRNTMFVRVGGDWLRDELNYLEKKLPGDKLHALLEEDYMGKPYLIDSPYLTSHNTVHHLYHFIRLQEKTGIDFSRMNTVVEWGGGYGNMAKLFTRLSGADHTYIIIDIPIISCVQWLYLSVVLGADSVRLMENADDPLVRGKINLLPVCFLKLPGKEHKFEADLFVATWSLSESSRYTQEYVAACDFFNAAHLLIAYHENYDRFPESGLVGKLAEDRGALIESIDFLPGSNYAFK